MKLPLKRIRRLEQAQGGSPIQIWVEVGNGRVRQGSVIKTYEEIAGPNVIVITEAGLNL